jgi:tetratricopeptide (TPR) repeat protein
VARRRSPVPGDVDYLPLSDAQRAEHAHALQRRAADFPDERAQVLCQAAEYYAMAGQADLAAQLFGQALADGGAVAGSVHGFFAAFLFAQGRQDEAFEVINQARRSRPVDPDVFLVIGETLAEAGHPAEAARWFTTGLVRYFGDLAGIDAEDLREDPDGWMLVRGRHRARQAAGLAPDHLDELAGQVQEERGAIQS